MSELTSPSPSGWQSVVTAGKTAYNKLTFFFGRDAAGNTLYYLIIGALYLLIGEKAMTKEIYFTIGVIVNIILNLFGTKIKVLMQKIDDYLEQLRQEKEFKAFIKNVLGVEWYAQTKAFFLEAQKAGGTEQLTITQTKAFRDKIVQFTQDRIADIIKDTCESKPLE